ncbi:alpha-beta hydrolase superfamily lysophospholipase [Kineococcus xinjiangensis]|uniref:Alpha-beta hydrolase superfamily lysophospholipase n=1 Tax=Kineococcus xinjiangensis TaxID=512762 RepID=A0A2S6IV79_9ACTN|nr:alpha/beta hydrolase [Kineococcus xinjiangensis]PPK98177.1 alpha-beta hydrolase superfamily lysophospholipase [Kineococcus xinjiangensis]
MSAGAEVRHVQRPGGRIAYEVHGSGPLVVCVPGMGELRSSYRRTAPLLVQAGFRVAAMDLRGHGGSDATFDRYDDVAAGEDVLAVVAELGGPAVVVGNSMGAGAAAWAAAERPDAVSGLVLLGPFVRNPTMNPLLAWAFRAAMAGPWAPRVWTSYLPKLYPGHRPDDLAEHVAAVSASMRRPGYAAAFRATTRTSHAPVEARLDEVSAPTLVVMGERDPDFPDPAAEGRWVAQRLRGELLLVPGAGHYPQVEVPGTVGPAIVEFAQRVSARA